MTDAAAAAAIIAFARAVRLDRRANPQTAADGSGIERQLAPKFHHLVETLLNQMMDIPPRVVAEYEKGGIGRPDLAFARPSEPARAFIELKSPDKSLVPRSLRGHDADQFRRFKELPLWGFCNFHTMHLYRRDDLQDRAVFLPATALDPATSDSQADRLIRRHDPTPFLAILELLACAQPMALRNARVKVVVFQCPWGTAARPR